jgi:Cu-processing system ATP-binding protein
MTSSLTLTLPQPLLEVSEVSKSFGRLPVLRRVSFGIRAGRITAILGPNAAGKSTIIKTILGLTRADSGRIVVNGDLVCEDPGYRAGIGYMPQAAPFPENLTGREVLAMLGELREEAGEDTGLLRELELEGELTKPVRTMSGGTRQKLNAAVAFMFHPSLLILDEPTAGLDPVASRILKQKIRSVRSEGATVILTSHVLAEVEGLADDVIVLLDGRVAYTGTLRHLVETSGEDGLEGAVAYLMQRATS